MGTDLGRGRRHLLEIVQEAVDGAGLRAGLGDVATHQLVSLGDGLRAQLLTELADDALAHELDVLAALRLDPLGVDCGLLGELLDDALRIVPRLVGLYRPAALAGRSDA